MFTDPNGEFPWLAIGIVAAFTYLKGAYDNRDEETGKWAWNIGKWDSDETTVIVGGSTNTDGNFTVYGGVSTGGVNTGYPAPVVGYNSDYGWGMGNANNPGYTELYYPSVNYNAPIENTIKGINSAREVAQQDWYVATEGGDRTVSQYSSSSYEEVSGINNGTYYYIDAWTYAEYAYPNTEFGQREKRTNAISRRFDQTYYNTQYLIQEFDKQYLYYQLGVETLEFEIDLLFWWFPDVWGPILFPVNQYPGYERIYNINLNY